MLGGVAGVLLVGLIMGTSELLRKRDKTNKLTLIGVFDLSSKTQTKRQFGYLFKEHFENEVRKLNEDFQTSLDRNVRETEIVTEIIDSESSTVFGSRKIMENVFDHNCNLTSYGIIGPGTNSQMKAVLDMVSSYQIQQASYGVMEDDIVGAKNVDINSGVNRYPYFNNIRTSADTVIELLCVIMGKLKWRYVSYTVTRNDKLNNNLCSKQDIDMSISVMLKQDVGRGVDLLTSPAKNLSDTNKPLVTVMLGDMTLDSIKNFAEALNHTSYTSKNIKHVWLVSEQFLMGYVDIFDALPNFKNQYFLAYHSPAISDDNLEPCINCNLAKNISRQLGLKHFITLGIARLIGEEYYTNLKLPKGKSNNVHLLYLDSTTSNFVKVAWTDGDIVNTRSLNLISNLGESKCSDPCDFGNYTYYRAGEPKTCFHCKMCNTLREVSNRTHCSSCHPTHKPSLDRSHCILITSEMPPYLTTVGQLIIISAALGVCFVMVTLVVFLANKHTPIIRAANRELCYVLFVGLVLCYLAAISLMLQPGVVICKLQIILLSLGGSLTITTILARAVRIIRIFTAKNVTLDTFLISLRHQALLIVVMVTAQLILASLSTINVKADMHVDINVHYQNKVYDVCSEPNPVFIGAYLVLFLGLLIITSLISFKARKLPTNYNEVTYTYFTVFSCDIILLSFICMRYSGGIVKQDGSVATAVITLVTTYFTLFLLFFNKIYIIYFNPDQNKIHNIPESPTLRNKRHRKESMRLVPSLVPVTISVTLPASNLSEVDPLSESDI